MVRFLHSLNYPKRLRYKGLHKTGYKQPEKQGDIQLCPRHLRAVSSLKNEVIYSELRTTKLLESAVSSIRNKVIYSRGASVLNKVIYSDERSN